MDSLMAIPKEDPQYDDAQFLLDCMADLQIYNMRNAPVPKNTLQSKENEIQLVNGQVETLRKQVDASIDVDVDIDKLSAMCGDQDIETAITSLRDQLLRARQAIQQLPPSKKTLSQTRSKDKERLKRTLSQFKDNTMDEMIDFHTRLASSDPLLQRVHHDLLFLLKSKYSAQDTSFYGISFALRDDVLVVEQPHKQIMVEFFIDNELKCKYKDRLETPTMPYDAFFLSLFE